MFTVLECLIAGLFIDVVLGMFYILHCCRVLHVPMKPKYIFINGNSTVLNIS